MSPRRIVDAHVHVWPGPHPEAAPTWHDPHPVEALLATLDAHGVDAAVQVTPSPEGWDNAYGVQVAAAHPERVPVVFGRIDPAAPDPEGRLRAWMATPRAAGVRLTYYGPDHGPPPGGLLGLEPFWAALERLRIPLSLFAPDAIADVVRIAERHPALPLIVDHMGLGVYPGCPDPLAGLRLLEEFAPLPAVRVKVSGLVEVSREPFPFRDVHEHLAAAVEAFGSDRLIWGSNHPVVLAHCRYDESLEYLEACEFLGEEDRRRLLGATIEALLSTTAGDRR